ncbi:MAG TPA: hypothetical protein VGR67_10605 [Candidatus Polarisedimenticolia bacterium]|jgi:hypothetical protein|nr:hypothetical protein [Candidatus Polarisedimenticolia bacterium]
MLVIGWKVPSPLPQQRQIAAGPVRGDEVFIPVFIEIEGDDAAGKSADRIADGGTERAVSHTCKDQDRVVEDGGGQVALAVGVEVAGGDVVAADA